MLSWLEYYEPQHKRYKYTYEKYFNLQTIGDKVVLTHLLAHEAKLRKGCSFIGKCMNKHCCAKQNIGFKPTCKIWGPNHIGWRLKCHAL